MIRSHPWLALVLPLLVLLLGLVACGPKKPAAPADPGAVVSALRARELPRALKAAFVVKIEGPDLQGSTTGAMVLARPDQFNINIQTPLRTPLVYLASDGAVVHAYLQQDGTFYRGDDALAVFAELTGGAVGVADLLQVLTGGLPLPDADVVDVAATEDAVTLSMKAPADAELRAAIDLRTGLVRTLSVRKDGVGDLFLVDIVRVTRFGGGALPEELRLVLPTLGWTATLTFTLWDELGVIPDVFVLEKPAGAAEKDLVEALRAVAAGAGASD